MSQNTAKLLLVGTLAAGTIGLACFATAAFTLNAAKKELAEAKTERATLMAAGDQITDSAQARLSDATLATMEFSVTVPKYASDDAKLKTAARDLMVVHFSNAAKTTSAANLQDPAVFERFTKEACDGMNGMDFLGYKVTACKVTLPKKMV